MGYRLPPTVDTIQWRSIKTGCYSVKSSGLLGKLQVLPQQLCFGSAHFGSLESQRFCKATNANYGTFARQPVGCKYFCKSCSIWQLGGGPPRPTSCSEIETKFLLCFSFLQTFDCNRVRLSELEFTSDFSLKITNTAECTVSFPLPHSRP